MDFNKILFGGRLTADPEVRYTAGGTPVCNLKIASNRKYQKDGEWKQEAVFMKAVLWGKMAEHAADNLKKGSRVFIEGRLEQHKWQTQDGQTKTDLIINTENVKFVDGKKKADNNPDTGGYCGGDDAVPY